MEVWVARGTHNFLPNNQHQLVVVQGSHIRLLLPWMRRPFVEGDPDLDWGFNPVTIILFILPALIVQGIAQPISTQLCINKPPVCP